MTQDQFILPVFLVINRVKTVQPQVWSSLKKIWPLPVFFSQVLGLHQRAYVLSVWACETQKCPPRYVRPVIIGLCLSQRKRERDSGIFIFIVIKIYNSLWQSLLSPGRKRRQGNAFMLQQKLNHFNCQPPLWHTEQGQWLQSQFVHQFLKSASKYKQIELNMFL